MTTHNIYAVRKGLHSHTKNCLFFSWEDAKEHIGTATASNDVDAETGDDEENQNGNSATTQTDSANDTCKEHEIEFKIFGMENLHAAVEYLTNSQVQYSAGAFASNLQSNETFTGTSSEATKQRAETEATNTSNVNTTRKRPRQQLSTKASKKDPNAPKRALTSYMIFCQNERANVRKENPNATVPQSGVILGERYRNLSVEEKMSYAQQAAALKEQYEKDMEEYMENKAETTAAEANEDFSSNQETKKPRKISKVRDSWILMMQALKEYHEKYGAFEVKSNNAQERTLGRWVREQRHQYKLYRQGKKSHMKEEKIKMLNEIGYNLQEEYENNQAVTAALEESTDNGGSPPASKPAAIPTKSRVQQREERWDRMFAALVEFHKANGHCEVKHNEDAKLYQWSLSQRREYKKLSNEQKCVLTATKMQKLNDLGFRFVSKPPYVKWEQRMQQLREFKEQHGHLKISVKHPVLGEFVSRQRIEYFRFQEGSRKVAMTEERIQDLTELGFIFCAGKRMGLGNKPKKAWEERLQELVKFKAENGHTRVPQHATGGLGEWVHSQRKAYKKLKAKQPSSLTTERVLKLTELGFVFDAIKHKRESKLLEGYTSDHGGRRSDTDDDDETSLAGYHSALARAFQC